MKNDNDGKNLDWKDRDWFTNKYFLYFNLTVIPSLWFISWLFLESPNRFMDILGFWVSSVIFIIYWFSMSLWVSLYIHNEDDLNKNVKKLGVLNVFGWIGAIILSILLRTYDWLRDWIIFGI